MARENDVNFGEIFCEAVDTIVNNKLSNLNYDITKTCRIVDATYGRIGKYTVQENNIRFEAYSTDTTLKNDDMVLVLIPNGDYNMQKIITSKVALDNDLTTSVMYSSPLNQMINFTGNIIEKDNIPAQGDKNDEKYFSLLANEEQRQSTSKLLYSINWDKYSGYDRLGISADFQTWLSEFNTVEGEYGLEFLFFTNKTSILDQEQKNATYRFAFTTGDMLGNPYNFESYFRQDKVIDISYLEDIRSLDIYFYQNGDFKNEDGEYIANANENDDEFNELSTSNGFSDNIFVGNISLILGYKAGTFTDDEVKISASNLFYSSLESDYDRNRKISLHWIHKVDDETFELIDSDRTDIEVYFMRYSQGEEDPAIFDIAGSGWTIRNLKTDDIFNSTLLIDKTLTSKVEINVKAICRIKRDDGNWAKYESNILSFLSTDIHIDETTRDAVLGLSIYCNDGSEGNYFIYNQNSEIINEGKGQGFKRTFSLRFNGIEIKKGNPHGLQIESIKWSLPQNTETNSAYTMLVYEDSYLPSDQVVSDKNNSNIITILKDENDCSQAYSIKNTWYQTNSHNTVSCTITTLEGNVYEASKELIFGKANSQGSNISVILQYTNNKNAYELCTDNQNNIIANPEVMTVKGLVYDLSGNQIKLDESTNWEWSFINNSNNAFKFANGISHTDSVDIIFDKNAVPTLSKNIFTILKVIINNVEAYLPLSIKTLDSNKIPRCNTMEGARKIIYDGQGVPSYYTDAYQLFLENNMLNNINWEINPINEEGYPTLETFIKDDTNTNHQALKAKPIYIKDKTYQCCVIGGEKNTSNGSTIFTIFWLQPLLIMQSAYDFAIVNNWDGTQQINDANILTSAIAIGKSLENSGKFSGIIVGEINEADSETSNTGLYGITEGALTFKLLDSGRAYFNSYVSGQSYVDVQFGQGENLIQSYGDSTYTKNILNFDLDEGILSFANNTANSEKLLIGAAQNSGYYLQLTDINNKNILAFKPDSYLIQSSNFTSDSTSGLQINLKNGIITGKSAVSFSNGENYIGTTSDGTNLLKLGKLRVAENGEVYYGNQTLANYIKSFIPTVNS